MPNQRGYGKNRRNSVMADGRFVAYYRVSTDRQGRSGLGLDAQRAAVAEYLNGGSWQLTAEFTEVESGRRGHRPGREKALAACPRTGATLVIAKLDRLSRNASFLLSLRDAGVEFVATDMPHANRLTVGIMALVAEDEAERISARTRAALAAAKTRGTKLGTPNLTDTARAKGREVAQTVNRAKAAARAADLAPIVEEIRAAGRPSLRAIAAELDARSIPAPRGGRWTAPAVMRLLAR